MPSPKVIDADSDGFSVHDACAGFPDRVAARLLTFIALLRSWSAHVNLIGPAEMPHLWRRHVFDSLQVLDHITAAKPDIVDLGSGSGFPGIVLACALAERPGARIHLIESRHKPAAFLRAAIAATACPALLVHERIENVSHETFSYVTARALAPLPLLFIHAKAFMATHSVGLFHKGREVGAEIELARKCWSFTPVKLASRSDVGGCILQVTELERRPS